MEIRYIKFPSRGARRESDPKRRPRTLHRYPFLFGGTWHFARLHIILAGPLLTLSSRHTRSSTHPGNDLPSGG